MSSCFSEETVVSVASKFHELKSDLEKVKREVTKAKSYLYEFLERFPFRNNPNKIDELKPEDLYNPPRKNYFFYYIEYKLRGLGRISVGSSKPWEDVAKNIDVFKSLLKILVNDFIPLHKKIDSEECEKLYGWGGDRIILKKIVSLYYLEDIVPIFNTRWLESIITSLNLLTCVKEISKKFNKSYSELSIGERFEVLNTVLLALKNQVNELRDLDNPTYAGFLVRAYCHVERPESPEIEVGASIYIPPLIFEPINELEVIALFSKYHLELGFPYLLRLGQRYPDAVVIDRNRIPRRIEFELKSSHFKEHDHDPSKVDFIICWIDDLPEEDDLKKKVKIIELRRELSKIIGHV